jgi:hypothetical protein
MTMLIFWVVMPCELVGTYQHFRASYRNVIGDYTMGPLYKKQDRFISHYYN